MRTGTSMHALAGAVLLLLASAALAADKSDADNERWLQVRTALFADRAIDERDEQLVQLDAPVRAEDAAVVPIAIRTGRPGGLHYVKRLYLVIDNNPSPVGARFEFSPEAGIADIETRVRIEEYTWMRAIAETSDGRLYMAKRYVKASGGCSAPAGKDLEEAMTRLGKMRLRVEQAAAGEPSRAQLMVSHPNLSGLSMDQVTRLYAPAHFVRKIDVSYAARPVLSAEVDFTISENPNFRFYFVPRGPGELKATVVDTNELTFETALAIKPGAN